MTSGHHDDARPGVNFKSNLKPEVVAFVHKFNLKLNYVLPVRGVNPSRE